GYLANYKRTGIKNIIGTGRELEAQRKDGSTLPIFLSVSEYKVGDQSLYTGTIRDLSREKNIERNLRQEREKYAGIINAAVDPIIVITAKGRIDSVNPAFSQFFGYRDEEVIGQNIKLLMPEPHHSQHDGYLANYKKTGIKNIIGTGRELLGQHKDGSSLPIFLSVSEYRLNDETLYTGTIRDISEEYWARQHLITLTTKAELIAKGDYTVKITPRDEQDLLGLALQRTTGILREVAEVAEKMAAGDTGYYVREQGADDILAQSINKMVTTIKEIAATADAISAGEVDTQIEARGPQDTLGIALGRLTGILRDVGNVAVKVAGGDYSVRLSQQGNKDALSKSINSMVLSLAVKTEESEKQLWLATGLSQLNEVIRNSPNIRTMAKAACQYIAKYLGVQIMTFYIIEDGTLTLQGSYAFNKRKHLGDSIGLGEGLVGQAALDQEMISITDVPSDYTRINSSIGDGHPGNIVVMPLVANDVTQGVIELGAFVELNDQKLAFLTALKDPLGMMVLSANEQGQKGVLLEQTQRQTEELQVQQEELKAANENLEEQTKQLLASQKQLRQQRDNLSASNQQLNDKTRALEVQRNEIELASKELELRSNDLAIASKYKSEFLANMSHELRTPLNSFLLLSQHLSQNKEGNLTAEQIEDLNIIFTGGSDLLSLINDIMDLSKVEAGKLSVNIENHELALSCTNLHSLLSPAAQNKGLEFTTGVADNCPSYLSTDVQRLEQILKNFLSNAFKFTESGSVRLWVSAAEPNLAYINPALHAQGTIAFAVSDTGIGIPENKQVEIFAAFQQQDGTTSRRYGGTGLGLTISKELAKLLGGEIHLNSIEGQGSTFTLYLPAQPPAKPGSTAESGSSLAPPAPASGIGLQSPLLSGAQATAALVQPSPASASRRSGPSSHEPTLTSDDSEQIRSGDKIILIIEDDPVFARLLLDIVRKSGHKGLLANTGTQGLYLALQYRPMGVLLDMGLPDLDGSEVIRQLKFHTDTQGIPVHIISGREPDAELMREKKVGFLMKPASEEDINQAVMGIELGLSTHLSNVLIIDSSDNDTIAQLLNHRGINCTTVKSGRAAMETLDKKGFDCLILDIELGDMSCFDLLERLHLGDKNSTLPLIVHTEQDPTTEQRQKLEAYSATIVFKSAETPESMLDEALSFINNRLGQEYRSGLPNDSDEAELESILKGRVILLVDDDMRNTFALSRNLQTHDIVVYEAGNGQAALDKLASQPDIDLVIMDIMMPVMDGYEAMQEIRKNAAFAELPVIALTAKAMSDEREKCIAAGASDYLTKPVNMDKLIAMLKVWLYKA
ncbi:MAG: response regulator, partial [Porticoccaceae bacterium]|nr:response regulator [Porticoccaceae bacterium]